MTVKIGNSAYILYPAFFIAIFCVIFLIIISLVLRNVIKERKQEKKVDEKYKITKWQKKYLLNLIDSYLEENNLHEFYDKYALELDDYMRENKYWNLDELLEIEIPDFVAYITLLLFEVAQTEFLSNRYDNAVLVLHSIDFINGGLDNPDFFEGEYPYIGEDIPEMKNHPDMTEEEARTLYLFESSIEELYSFVDPDIEKIPEDAMVLDFCKRISMKEMEDASGDICSVIDIAEVNTKSRTIAAKALFNHISILLGSVLAPESEDYAKYVDEYRRYSIRALASAIDNQLYSDIIESIDE